MPYTAQYSSTQLSTGWTNASEYNRERTETRSREMVHYRSLIDETTQPHADGETDGRKRCQHRGQPGAH